MRGSLLTSALLLAFTLAVASHFVFAASAGGGELPQQPVAQEPQHEEQPRPDASGVYRAGNGVSAPQLIYSVDPEFTASARKKKLSGACVVRLVVDTHGLPQDVTIAKSIADEAPKKFRSAALELDTNAIQAVEQYRFNPARYQGKAVPVQIEVTVNYRIY
jgi:TonB family protein